MDQNRFGRLEIDDWNEEMKMRFGRLMLSATGLRYMYMALMNTYSGFL